MTKLLNILNIVAGWALIMWGVSIVVSMLFGIGLVENRWSLPFTIGLILVWLATHLLTNNKN